MFYLSRIGTRAANCRVRSADNDARRRKYCFHCGGSNHEAKDCRKGQQTQATRNTGSYRASNNPSQTHRVACAARVTRPTRDAPAVSGDKLEFPPDENMRYVTFGACVVLGDEEPKKGLPIVTGRIGDNNSVEVLRDSGCDGVLVKRSLVNPEQLTGESGCVWMMNNTMTKVPIAKLNVDTPYYTGEVEALCLSTPLFELVIGNIPGARDHSTQIQLGQRSQGCRRNR